jgi:hypothetical protein
MVPGMMVQSIPFPGIANGWGIRFPVSKPLLY